jgi:hypothetical protein
MRPIWRMMRQDWRIDGSEARKPPLAVRCDWVLESAALSPDPDAPELAHGCATATLASLADEHDAVVLVALVRRRAQSSRPVMPKCINTSA